MTLLYIFGWECELEEVLGEAFLGEGNAVLGSLCDKVVEKLYNFEENTKSS